MNPRAVPKWPKILPRRPQDGLEEVFFSHVFLSSILVRFGVRFWLHLGPLLGAQIGNFWNRFFDDVCMLFQDRPKSAQEQPEPPRASQEPPKSAQERPKSLPRASQERPRAAQERPREPQERQKVSQEGPRAAKTDPRGAQQVRKDNGKITRAVQAKQADEKGTKR